MVDVYNSLTLFFRIVIMRHTYFLVALSKGRKERPSISGGATIPAMSNNVGAMSTLPTRL